MAEVPKQLRQYIFKPGNKMGGRKKGKTLKEYSRDYLSKMTDEERVKFLNSIDPDMVWRMAEGNPNQNTDLTTKGEKLPAPIYGGISRHEGNTQGFPAKETD